MPWEPWAGGLIRLHRSNPTERNPPVRDSLLKGDFVMPVWMDILLNVIGYAGFVGVATFNHSREQVAKAGDEIVS